MELPPVARASYIAIIDGILASSDLTTISEKRIRRGLQEETGHDLAPYKASLKQLIMQRFDIFADQCNVGESEEQPFSESAANGHTPSAPDSSTPTTTTSASPGPSSSSPQKRSADIIAHSTPPKKKRKDDTVDSDAAFAARLQAEENLRARPTRGASTRKSAPAKKRKAPSKTAKKVKASDDSDLEVSGAEKREVVRTGGFHKPLTLSPALSTLLGGETSLSRPQTVKKMWEYIRQNDLQDPSDRRHIRCDDLMRPVFKQDRVHMFTMTKILNQNLYNPDE
ncbi:hypothetical protein FQN57_001954 [Myotisia sp. PD_48]|nr:hypothetical protein FQN57_001954 [Myotisia sp. PD_48]